MFYALCIVMFGMAMFAADRLTLWMVTGSFEKKA